MKETYQAQDNFVLQGTPETTEVNIAGGQGTIAARTPLAFDSATGYYVKATDTTKATRLSAYEVDATNVVAASVYKQGQFNIDLIQFDATVTTDAKKAAHFAASEITLGKPYTA